MSRGPWYRILPTLLLTAPLQAAADPLPLSYFTRHDVSGTIKISPDGEYFAVSGGRYGREGVVFMRRSDMKTTGGIRAVDGDELWRFDWVSPTRVVYSMAERHFGRARPYGTGEIFAMDRDGGRHELLYGIRAGQFTTGTRLRRRETTRATGELLSSLRDDEDHILIAEYPWRQRGRYLYQDRDAWPRVVLLDVYDGRRDVLDSVPLPSADVLIDREERVRFGIGLDEDAEFRVVWKPRPEAEWEHFELPGFREHSVVPRLFSRDNESVLLTGVREGESLDALYRLHLASGELEPLYQREDSDIEEVMTDLPGDEVIGVRVHAARPEYHWLDREHPDARLYRMLQNAFAGKAFEITSATRDGRLAVVFVYSDVNPGDYYLFDTEEKHAEYLMSSRRWVDPRVMRPKEAIAVESRDGWTLHGYLTRPRDDSGPFALVVLPHGGPYGVRDRWEYDWEVQLLANRGYAVLQVNYRGSEGYGMDFAEAGFGQWGATMQDDLSDATRWAIDTGIADADRICIFGTSYGGYAALMGVIREPDLYRCAIGHAGVYDLELMFESGDVPLFRVGRAFLETILGEDVERLRQYSPTHNAAQIEVPVVLVHGKDDERADYQHAERMKESLTEAGRDFEWIALGREGHGIYDEETREQVYGRILEFLEQHAPSRGRAPAR